MSATLLKLVASSKVNLTSNWLSSSLSKTKLLKESQLAMSLREVLSETDPTPITLHKTSSTILMLLG